MLEVKNATVTQRKLGIEMLVPTKTHLLPHQKRGLSYTASGYGSRIPTATMVFFAGRWRRVHCRIYSNSGTCFIGEWADGLIVDSVYQQPRWWL